MKATDFKLRLLDKIALVVLRREADLSDAEVSNQLDEVGRTFALENSCDPSSIIEIDRIILRYKLQIYSRRDLAYEVVRKSYNDAVSKGFSDLLDEGTVKIYYSQYCIRRSEFAEAKVILNEVLLKASGNSSAAARVKRELERDAVRLLKSMAD